ncbi:MAG: oxidoreductase [Sciscionella sp.]|nr:oxidoreductase [Sciscionella sp.]
MDDPLAPLLELPAVSDAVAAAREAVDRVHAHPANRTGWPATSAEASVRAARASAVLAGGSAEIPPDAAIAEPVLAGALRVAEAVGPLLGTWQRAPLQALARLHVLAAADLLTEPDELGRPRRNTAGRLDLLAQLVAGGTSVPAAVLAAVVHGELLTLTPFGSADGVVARAASRLTLIAFGLDQKALTVPEVSFLRRQDRYSVAAQGFSTGDPDAVAAWLVFCCEAIIAGADEAIGIAEATAR